MQLMWIRAPWFDEAQRVKPNKARPNLMGRRKMRFLQQVATEEIGKEIEGASSIFFYIWWSADSVSEWSGVVTSLIDLQLHLTMLIMT